ncbi:AF4/FMR2 family member 1-like isoform X2 [Anomalospiza imberbis]|uniref:AF4/FMR2 family member 1-like isoform X2 n=1 Tax=Anomalospiza imberbis TaxID=187417 RepID=UPI00358F1AEA
MMTVMKVTQIRGQKTKLHNPKSFLSVSKALQSQHKRMAPAQPSSSESESTRDCHSSSVSALPRAPAPEPIVHMYEQSIEGILKEMNRPLSPLLPPLQSPARTETSKFPLQAKAKKPSDVPLIEDILRESQPDGSAAQKQKQADTASETLLSSQPRTAALQSRHKRMAPAQPSSSESESTRDCHSSSVCDRDISSCDSEEDNLLMIHMLDLPACEPEPSASKKWRLNNLVTQTM